MSAILVTGGCGFIGSHLIDKLLAQNRKVICVDNLNNYYNPAIKKLNQQQHLKYKRYSFYEGDIRNWSFIENIFNSNRIVTVVHLAAMAGVRPSLENPVLYTDVNINGTQVILEAMKSRRINKFVFASSSSVYGNNEKIPFTESDMVDRQVSPYGATKKMGEEMVYTYSYLYKIPTVCLRFFTVYGPRQRPEMAIHKFVRMMMNGERIPFFGDGTTARDYTYIDDIISGILSALETRDEFMIYNLGNSEPVKLSELVSIISELTGENALLDEQPMPPGDVLMTFSDISRAGKRLDYVPETSLIDGIEKFVHWFKKVKNDYPELF